MTDHEEAPGHIPRFDDGISNECAVLIPVKAFDDAKGRLAPDVSASSRRDLARQMATHVVTVAAPLPVAIVCDHAGVAEWAEEVGASLIWAPGTDLNGAVTAGVETLHAWGFRHAIVSHSDLPLAAGFSRLGSWPGVTLVPDRHRTGTNVLSLPTSAAFVFQYGAGSYRKHTAEAVRRHLGLRIVHEPDLAWDIDHPSDLDHPDIRSNDA